jgi:hypothetical protein
MTILHLEHQGSQRRATAEPPQQPAPGAGDQEGVQEFRSPVGPSKIILIL